MDEEGIPTLSPISLPALCRGSKGGIRGSSTNPPDLSRSSHGPRNPILAPQVLRLFHTRCGFVYPRTSFRYTQRVEGEPRDEGESINGKSYDNGALEELWLWLDDAYMYEFAFVPFEGRADKAESLFFFGKWDPSSRFWR